MLYAVVELKYVMKKTFIVRIKNIKDYKPNALKTQDFLCYISTNLLDEPNFQAKYYQKFNGSPGLFKVFILAVKDSIEEAIHFQERNRVKSVSKKFRDPGNTEAELKAENAKRTKNENILRKAAKEKANEKNTAHLTHLLSNSKEIRTSGKSDPLSADKDNDVRAIAEMKTLGVGNHVDQKGVKPVLVNFTDSGNNGSENVRNSKRRKIDKSVKGDSKKNAKVDNQSRNQKNLESNSKSSMHEPSTIEKAVNGTNENIDKKSDNVLTSVPEKILMAATFNNSGKNDMESATSNNSGESCMEDSMDYNLCDQSNIQILSNEFLNEILNDSSVTLPYTINEAGMEEFETAINSKTLQGTSIEMESTLSLQNMIYDSEAEVFEIDTNGTLIRIVSEHDQNFSTDTNVVIPIEDVSLAPTATNVLKSTEEPMVNTVKIPTDNIIANDMNNADMSEPDNDKNYKEAYFELEKKRENLEERNLALQNALVAAQKIAPVKQVPFTEKDGGRLYVCGVFIDAIQCKLLDQTSDNQKFVNNLSLVVFGRMTLKSSSVTGAISKNYKYPAKSALDPIKLQLIYGIDVNLFLKSSIIVEGFLDLVAERTKNNKNFDEANVNKIISKKIANIVGADRSKEKRKMENQNA